MRNVAILALGLVFVAGCGSNVVGTNTAGGVTLEQARATCQSWDGAFNDSLFNAFVLGMEAFRDDGLSESDCVRGGTLTCGSAVDGVACLSCLIQTCAAVYN